MAILWLNHVSFQICAYLKYLVWHGEFHESVIYLEFIRAPYTQHIFYDFFFNIDYFEEHVLNWQSEYEQSETRLSHDYWLRHQMENFSALLAFCVTGEFPAQRPVTRSFDVFFDLRLNKHLSKQSWGLWFETPSCSLWRHYNVVHNMWCDEIINDINLVLITQIFNTSMLISRPDRVLIRLLYFLNNTRKYTF